MSASRATRPHPFTVSRRTILAGGAVSALAVLAACSSKSASQETSPAASGAASTGSGSSSKSLPKSTVVPAELDSGLGSGQADGVFPRTVVHYQGETTINAAPTKVVVISTGQADAMLTLGMCPIGSTTASGAEGPVSQYLKDAYPDQVSAIEAITRVGSRNEPDIEAIGALKPDLILTNIARKDDADTLYKNLTAIAPTGGPVPAGHAQERGGRGRFSAELRRNGLAAAQEQRQAPDLRADLVRRVRRRRHGATTPRHPAVHQRCLE